MIQVNMHKAYANVKKNNSYVNHKQHELWFENLANFSFMQRL